MLYYELKKIWVKRGTKIALLILAGMLAFACFLALDVSYINGNGDSEYGLEAISKLKAAKKEWTGTLTEKVIAEVIAENARINETPEARSDNVQQKEIAYGWKQGFEDIRNLLVCSYCDFQVSDYYRPDSLVPADAASFYENRIRNLKEWLEMENQQYMFSEKEREFLIDRFETLETPFQYDYAQGWKQLFEYSVTIIMLTMLVLGFVVAGIFSGEFTVKADAVFYSAYHGRKRAVAAKLGAGLIFVTIIYFLVMLLYSIVVLGSFGADGAGLLIQSDRDGWKSFYNITNIQEYWLIIFGGYIGTMFSLLLTMLISARTKSTALAATIPFILIFIPSFLKEIPSNTVSKIIGLLPDRLLDIHQILRYYNLYTIAGKITGAIGIMLLLYGILSLLLCPLIYQTFRRSEAG